MQWKPNKWLAFVLGLLLQPIGMFYVVKPWWALFYFLFGVITGITEFWLSVTRSPYALKYFSFTWLIMIACAIHAHQLAKRSGTFVSRPWYSKWYGLISICFASVLVVFCFRGFLYEPFRMPSSSMEPSLTAGSYIVVKKWGYGNYGTFGIPVITGAPTLPVNRGDVFVFRYPPDPSLDYVKRIIGLPGDVISYKSKQLVINGVTVQTEKKVSEAQQVIVDERFGSASWRTKLLNNIASPDFEGKVPEHQYFVLGDNRDNSEDSRYWGFVPETNLVGKVAYVF
ncbi:signal peptidase I [Collimonas fungivorans]|uniref:signal peptidase I n=1 Tax=Collimonas fungivorans TaxID=158899 RepID=UPI0005A0DFD7|nr:signal peptidase I [Collimonas fungivorans]